MARAFTPDALAEVVASFKRPILFYEGEFATGTLRLCTHVRNQEWNGKIWTAAGNLIGISSIEEISDIRAVNFTLSLKGESQAIRSIMLSAARQGLEGSVWIGFLTSADAIVADPFLAFRGRLDVPDLVDDGKSATISVRYESRLIGLTREVIRRYTPEDQALDYPGDKGFDQVAILQDASIKWRPTG